MALSSDGSTPDSALTAPPQRQQQKQSIQKGFSCVLCAQRKVKCDKAPGGCANCTRARVECVYKAPPPPRRRKKGVRDIDVYTRLRLYEDRLRELGEEPEEVVRKALSKSGKRASRGGGDEDSDREPKEETKGIDSKSKGVLVSSGNGKSRYLENTLWTSLGSEFRLSEALLLDEDTSSDEEETAKRNVPTSLGFPSEDGHLIWGTSKIAANLRPLHPQPVQMFKLWQTYLDNVNPLMKLFHSPTVQQLISNASGRLDNLPKNVEALLFSIYCMAVESMSEAECDAIMGESKTVVSQRFKTATQHALVNANVLKTSDLMVLQALVLFNTAIQTHDSRVVWILTGVASRIGQRIGLHRDPATMGLPPFDCEIRRRVWWQILMQDGFAEKLAGTGGHILYVDVKLPSNLNDSDLFPGMKELPKEHDGATEMMFFLIRCHIGEFLRSFANKKSTFDGIWNKLSTNAATLTVKDKAIDELEALYERKYLRYCDHSVGWHFMCSYLVKAILAMLRFIAHNPEHHGGSRADIPQTEKDKLFRLAVQVVTYQNFCYTAKEMQGYLWHINSHFQWKGFIYVVNELRERTQGDEVDHAWKQVRLVFDFHPSFGHVFSRRALSIAVASFTLKAWDAYVSARGVPEGGEPVFIKVLRARQAKRGTTPSSSESSHLTPPSRPQSETMATTLPAMMQDSYNAQGVTPAPVNPSTTADPFQNFNWDAGFADSLDPMATLPELPPMDPNQMNWGVWDNLLADFETAGNGSGGTWDYGMQ
ncbi:hypothetical protein K458DRAFT_421427 [Lentithecium fluviatile CBS 122367]|uniref:Zn(2)-C6 fungal-type domain-containing protein n=1 Tax=Lentithecium fluviatile CBS 122367 TaxID=1168545 RepID=A0A6G1IRB9_9PLEO|nr:hypothetical protein K458DRAFT_421427 [Lentithecium fluviatile CBS 122367]